MCVREGSQAAEEVDGGKGAEGGSRSGRKAIGPILPDAESSQVPNSAAAPANMGRGLALSPALRPAVLSISTHTNQPPLQAAEADLLRISNKVRFILAVVGGELKLSNRKRGDIEAELEREGYDRLPSAKKALAVAATMGEEEEEEEGSAAAGSYEYLLSMPLASLTHEKVEALQEGGKEEFWGDGCSPFHGNRVSSKVMCVGPGCPG